RWARGARAQREPAGRPIDGRRGENPRQRRAEGPQACRCWRRRSNMSNDSDGSRRPLAGRPPASGPTSSPPPQTGVRCIAGDLALVLLLGPAGRALAETDAERRLRVLEETIRRQQEELKDLRRQIDEQRTLGEATRKQAEEATKEVKTASAPARKGPELPDWLGRTTVFGDGRGRHESFYHQPHKKRDVVTACNRKPNRARPSARVP